MYERFNPSTKTEGLLCIILHCRRFDDCNHVHGAVVKGCLGESDARVSVLGIDTDRLCAVSNRAVGKIGTTYAVHGGRVSPESVNGRVRVVGALV
jgi:hypothetical protein